MIRAQVLGLGLALAASGLAVTVPAADASGVKSPMHFTLTRPVAGPSAGQATISWKQVPTAYKTHTTGFRIETALTQFSPYGHGLPLKGRHYHVFTASASARKLTLGPKLLAAAGAPLGSGNFLYYRVFSVDKVGSAVRTYSNGQLGQVGIKGLAPGAGDPITVASYNVRMAKLDLGTSHDWYKYRVSRVAALINSWKPGIVTMQEMMPWQEGPGHPTNSLIAALGTSTPYRFVSGTNLYRYSTINAAPDGQQILYDATKYTLTSQYGQVGSMADPATYAEFVDNATGQPFWVFSMHLQPQTASATAQRRADAEKLLTKVAALNAGTNEPVILAGDQNDWQNNQAAGGDACHDVFTHAGYYDTAAAVRTTNLQYPSVNNFRPLKANTFPVAGGHAPGFGSRYDFVMTKGMPGASSFTNVITRPGGVWPSDHDMVVAKFTLP